MEEESNEVKFGFFLRKINTQWKRFHESMSGGVFRCNFLARTLGWASHYRQNKSLLEQPIHLISLCRGQLVGTLL